MSAKRKRTSTQARVVTTGTTIHFEEPHSNRKPKTNPAVVVVQEVNPVGGFVNFLREHAVVGLAIGFVIGVQAQNLVKQLVTSFIDPAFHLLFGQALVKRDFTLQFHGRTADFPWGAFAYVLSNFIFVLAAVYAIVKIFNLDKLDKEPVTKKAKEAAKNVSSTATIR